MNSNPLNDMSYEKNDDNNGNAQQEKYKQEDYQEVEQDQYFQVFY